MKYVLRIGTFLSFPGQSPRDSSCIPYGTIPCIPDVFVPPEISFSRAANLSLKASIYDIRLHNLLLVHLFSLNSVAGCPRSFDAVRWL